MKNYYEILNLPLSASVEEIKKNYRVLAKKYHPDTCQEKKLYHFFNVITLAYQTLMDPQERRKYNEKLLNICFKPMTKENRVEEEDEKIKIIYSRSLGALAKRGFFLSNLPKSYRKNRDLKYDVEVFLDYKKAETLRIFEIDVPTKYPCPECRGQDHYCTFCLGKGYIMRAMKVKVALPRTPLSGEIFEINFNPLNTGQLAVIRASKLRIKINLRYKNTSYKRLNHRWE